jgi:hypothetical protein
LGAFSARLELSVTAISLNCGSESDQKAIREQLARILGSRPFAQARRMQRFLEYIVNEALAGRNDRLKAYNIALEVFDRPETFDPIVDPLVRVEAARLREKIREYYVADGQRDPTWGRFFRQIDDQSLVLRWALKRSPPFFPSHSLVRANPTQ